MVNRSKYKELFSSEAREHLDNIDANLLKFEKNTKDKKATQELMRHAHTLKGMASEMGYGDLSNLAHSFEGMVENIKNGLSSDDSSALLFGALDELRSLVEGYSVNTKHRPAHAFVDKVGELEQVDMETQQAVVERPELFRKITEVKIDTKSLDTMVNLAAELMVNKMRLENTSSQLQQTRGDALSRALEEHAQLIDELQYQVLQLRLTPLSHVFNRFPRMVRDLAKKEEKDIEFLLSGGEIELDRSILDQIGEPLLHLLRNSIDHGIQKKGTITLSANQERDFAVIKISDNGEGIDWDTLKTKRDAAGSTLPLEEFLFSGISTSETITQVSGRGVGLSVVKKKIEELGGDISTISSSTDAGTTFILRLPISVAIIKALIITVRGQTFAVPITNVDRLIQMKQIIHEKQADQEITVIDDQEVPLIRLDKMFGLDTEDTIQRDIPANSETAGVAHSNQMVFLSTAKDKKIGFVIDGVQTQQDIIVKPLIEETQQGKGYFSAVTILGDGNPVPIIDVDSITANTSVYYE